MGNPRCKWVRDRLPLLEGGELVGSDRRKVERHLIGCPACRQYQGAIGKTLEVLRAASDCNPIASDVPSLWPALARQIRESRRPAATPAFWPVWSRWAFWPVVGLGVSLGLLAAAAVVVGPGPGPTARTLVKVVGRETPATSSTVVTAPTAHPKPLRKSNPMLTSTPTAAPPRREPSGPSVEASVVEFNNTAPSRMDYDNSLDRGTPMGPDPRQLTH